MLSCLPVGVHPTVSTSPPTPAVTRSPRPSEETTLTICERLLQDATKLLLGENEYRSDIFVPTCTDIGRFAPRQCQSVDYVLCWCVDQDTGEEILDTRSEPGEGYSLDCSSNRLVNTDWGKLYIESCDFLRY